MNDLEKLNRLAESHGELRPGKGNITGVIGLILACLGFLGVLAFHFPEYLTTPQLRKSYSIDLLRQLLLGALVMAGALALFNVIRSRARWLALASFALVADLVQYWTHRAYHEVPVLWRLHAVHHSVKSMDWLAGSRQHIVELLITRTLVPAPIYVLGFSKEVIDAFIIIVGFQAVFNHASVSVRLGPLRYLIVTPNFHHWHHSQDDDAIDRNHSAHFAFLDHLFGAAIKSGREWPERYGVQGDYVPDGFFRQQAFPFTWKG